MCATLHDSTKAETSIQSRNADLTGTLVSSLHRVKDTENNGRYAISSDWPLAEIIGADVGYFVFQDLSIRREGEYRLKFSLFELQRFVPRHLLYFPALLTACSSEDGMTASYIKSILSKPFKGARVIL
jgi:Velvet factor